MHEKKSFAQRAEEFLSGKGFYIVLFVCIAVIGVSAWLLLFSQYSPLDVGDTGDYQDVFGDEPASNPTDIGGNTDPELPPTPVKPQDTPIKDGNTGAGDKNNGGSSAGESGNKQDTLTVQPKPNVPDNTDKPAPPEDDPKEDESAVTDPKQINFIWPVNGAVIMEYSPDRLVYDRTMEDWRTHDGLDVGVTIGTKVVSAANGTVREVYDDDFLGTTVVIDHGAGVMGIYSNLAAMPTVTVGDSVTMGSVIGSVGSTALYEAGDTPHLHFSLTVGGESVDPTEYLPRK